MDDVIILLFARMSGDAPLAALLGASGGDTRIYQFYEGEAEVDPTTPGYITVSQNAGPENTIAVENPVFQIAVWARTIEQVTLIRDRLIEILHQKRLVTAIGRRVYSKVVNESQNFIRQPNYAGKTLHLRMSWSAV